MKPKNKNTEKREYKLIADYLTRGLIERRFSHPLFVTLTYEQDSKDISDGQIAEHVFEHFDTNCRHEIEFLFTIERHADLQKHVHAIVVNDPRISALKKWKWGYSDIKPVRSPLSPNMEKVSSYMYKCQENNWRSKTYWSSIEIKS